MDVVADLDYLSALERNDNVDDEVTKRVAAHVEKQQKAIALAQDYINNILGLPSPDFMASVELEVEDERRP